MFIGWLFMSTYLETTVYSKGQSAPTTHDLRHKFIWLTSRIAYQA